MLDQLIIQLFLSITSAYDNQNEEEKNNSKALLTDIRFDMIIDLLYLDLNISSTLKASFLKASYYLMNIKNSYGYNCSLLNLMRLIYYIETNKEYDNIEFFISFISYNALQNIKSQLIKEEIETEVFSVFLFLNRVYNDKAKHIINLLSVKDFIQMFQSIIYNNTTLYSEELSIDFHKNLLQEIKVSLNKGKTPLLEKEFVLYLLKNEKIISELNK